MAPRAPETSVLLIFFLFQVSRLKEQAELLESKFVGMETFGSLGSVIAAFAVFNIVGILAFAAYGLRNHLKGEQPTRIGQCVVS